MRELNGVAGDEILRVVVMCQVFEVLGCNAIGRHGSEFAHEFVGVDDKPNVFPLADGAVVILRRNTECQFPPLNGSQCCDGLYIVSYCGGVQVSGADH